MNATEKLNMAYDSLNKLELIEKVLLELDVEVNDLIKVKHDLNAKMVELNNQAYEEKKKNL